MVLGDGQLIQIVEAVNKCPLISLAFSILVVFTMLVSCGKSIMDNGVEFVDDVSLALPEQGTNFDFCPGYYQYWEGEENNDYLFLLNDSNNAIIGLPVGQNKDSRKNIRLVTPSYGFFVADAQSIWVLNGDLKTLVEIDWEGSETQTYNLFNQEFSDQLGFPYYTYAEHMAPLLVTNSRMIFSPLILSVYEDKMAEMFKRGAILKTEIKTDSLSFGDIGIYPSIYHGPAGSFGQIGNTVSYCLNNKNELILSFPADPMIYAIDLKTGIFSEKKIAKSQYISSIEPFSGSISSDDRLLEKYEVSSPFYYKILFDPKNELYYRVCLHAQAYKDKDGVRQFEDRPWSILTIDTDFEVIGEMKFEPREKVFRNVLVARGCLWVGDFESIQNRSTHQLVYSKYRRNLTDGKK